MVVHLDGRPDDHDDHGLPEIARVEGHGPVTRDWIREVLGPHARFTIRPVFDPLGQVPVDAYEIPARHRRAVRLISPADVFPFSSCTSNTDAGRPHRPLGTRRDRGASEVGNYGPMTTTHHRIKTFGHLRVKQPFPGIFLWRDHHGGFYLRDHTGTRRLDQAA